MVWECRTCTLHNAQDLAPVCEVCQTPRNSSDWEPSDSGPAPLSKFRFTVPPESSHSDESDNQSRSKRPAPPAVSSHCADGEIIDRESGARGGACEFSVTVSQKRRRVEQAQTTSPNVQYSAASSCPPRRLRGLSDAIGDCWTLNPPFGRSCVLCQGVNFSAQNDRWTCGYQNLRMVGAYLALYIRA